MIFFSQEIKIKKYKNQKQNLKTKQKAILKRVAFCLILQNNQDITVLNPYFFVFLGKFIKKIKSTKNNFQTKNEKRK